MIVKIKRQDSAESAAYWQNFEYKGPQHVAVTAVLANESYLIASQSSDKKAPVIREYKKHFGAGCSKALSCQSVCPMGIETLTSIMKMNRK